MKKFYNISGQSMTKCTTPEYKIMYQLKNTRTSKENYVPISFGNSCCSSILDALPAASISTTEEKKKAKGIFIVNFGCLNLNM